MNKYLAFFKNIGIEVEARTTLEAELKAAKQFKADRSIEIIVLPIELNGKPITHCIKQTRG